MTGYPVQTESEQESFSGRLLDRDAVKMLALATMLLNHVATIFLQPFTLRWLLYRDLGFFTCIEMCFFLVEGIGYTRSVTNYGKRLLLFAALSQLPYMLAFSEGTALSFNGFNVIVNLFLCFCLVLFFRREQSRSSRIVFTLAVFAASLTCDWGPLAPFMTLLFMKAGKDRKALGKAFLLSMAVLALGECLQYSGKVPVPVLLRLTLGAAAGQGLAALTTLFLYNGKRAEHGRNFFKWFSYCFYPVHLAILGLLRIHAGL
ncbi:MAG: conjugal transfer protein TraX [Lachnospiraceae bacterium]|jgi:hypothetical protein|nr:conjugal transfer protein TraX [Lachnospiraceae bacterium]